MTVLDYRAPEGKRSLHWLWWAIYLGMSWTWCIGMFLPVLLVRDYGGWAWLVFAVPNVIGAAAMGWMLRDGDSEKNVANHRHAVEAFALVTATFQIFFALWVFQTRHMPGGSAWLTLALAAAVFIASRIGATAAIIAAAIAFVVSMVCAYMEDQVAPTSGLRQVAGKDFSRDLIALAPIFVFGFLLCPYLDPTFHRARQGMPTDGARRAFGVGFGFFFLAMIHITLAYAWIVIAWLTDLPNLPVSYLKWIGVHWTIQLAQTIGLHWDAGSWGRGAGRALITTAMAAGIWYLSRFMRHPSMEPGELVYRLFMAFYGLVFPAYVWLCMIPFRGGMPSRAAVVTFAVTIAAAAPFYYVGFIGGLMTWLIPGLVIVLLGRFAIRREASVAA